MLLALVSSRVLVAQEIPVPTDIQAAIFQKIFSYDRGVRDETSVEVAVVHTGEVNDAAEHIASDFLQAGVSARTVPAERLPDEITRVYAAYLLPEASAPDVRTLCAKHQVLSISGVPELAERGEVSIAIGESEHKPEIVIHVHRLRAEGHTFSSELLKLARIVR